MRCSFPQYISFRILFGRSIRYVEATIPLPLSYMESIAVFFDVPLQFFLFLRNICSPGIICNTLPSILHITIFLFFRHSMCFPRKVPNRKPLPLSYTQSSARFFDISANSFPIYCAPAPVVLRHNLLHCAIQMIVNGAGSASILVSNIRWTVSQQQLLNSILLGLSQTAPPYQPVKVQIDIPCTSRRIHATVRQLSCSVQNQCLHHSRLA